jgi:SAM-dependent methyltransferase
MNWKIIAGLLAVVAAPAAVAPWSATGAAPAIRSVEQIKTDVPFVPTSEETVEAMLRLAQVGPDDLVYDLGCGDGRIVVTAAKRFGARAIGVDINPERIQESTQNALQAGVTNRVRFVQGDLFTADIQNATVVSLYLLPSVNLRLRPKLLSELRPGTRIVSHSFDMGDWRPDQTRRVGGYTTIYGWVVPANATGSWNITIPGGPGMGGETVEITQQFQKIGGSMVSGGKRIPLRDARLEGDRIEFTVDRMNGRSDPMRFTGRIRGDQIEGMAGESGTRIAAGQIAWSARRDPTTMVALDGRK